MNCKPGDLAMVVRNVYAVFGCNYIGTPVEVTIPYKTEIFGLDAWKLRHRVKCPGCGVMLDAMYDADLQPIRGPRVGADEPARIDKPEEVTA